MVADRDGYHHHPEKSIMSIKIPCYKQLYNKNGEPALRKMLLLQQITSTSASFGLPVVHQVLLVYVYVLYLPTDGFLKFLRLVHLNLASQAL